MSEPPPEAMPVDQALRQAAAGDTDAWAELVRHWTPRVYGLLLRQCGDGDLAEELTQAAFVKMVASFSTDTGYQERGRFESWLFRVAMNGLRDEMRRRKRQARPIDMGPAADAGDEDFETTGHGASGMWASAQQQVILGGPNAAEDPGEMVSRVEQIERLRAAIAGMSEADREILHLRHTAGLSFPQIADTLGQPLGTVLARAHRAVGKLRQMLDEKDDDKTAPQRA